MKLAKLSEMERAELDAHGRSFAAIERMTEQKLREALDRGFEAGWDTATRGKWGPCPEDEKRRVLSGELPWR